ncbi:MAG TPA: TonB-dependent receptor [Terriglobia bacterium]|nr:TonB-dependent receptor [Terriglobia bacterium]
MTNSSSKVKLAFFVMGLLMLPAELMAQAANAAQVRGTIKDSTGAVVPRVSVTITNEATHMSEKTVADEMGRYIFNGLPPASYTMKVELTGFKTVVRTKIVLRVGSQTDLDFTLEVGEVTQTVDVTAATPLLNSVSATLGTEVTNRYIVDMPLLDRALTNLTFLAPGVTEVPGAGVDAIRGTNFVSNGQRNATAEVRLDGGLSTVPESGEGGNTIVNYQPTLEIIQEFKVQNNSFSAEYGNNGGTVVNIVTKSGTDEFHGSGWWFFRRPRFDANDFFSNRDGQPKGDYKKDEWGGSIGGPIKKQKAFFFFDFLKTREDDPGTFTTTVPTAAEKRGDFSNTFNDDGSLQQLFNPFDVHQDASGNWIRAPFANNIIPDSMIDPVARNIMSLYPDPTSSGDPVTGRNNYTKKFISSYPSYQFDIKLDYLMTDKTRFSGRYSRSHSTGDNPYPSLGDNPTVLDGATSIGNNQNVVLEHNWTPTPTILWTNRLGVDRSYEDQKATEYDPAKVGFPPELNGYFGLKRFPDVGPEEYAHVGQSCCTTTVKGQTQWMYSSALNKVMGGHNLKFGWEQRIFFNNFWQPDYPTGQFIFGRTTTMQDVFNPDYSQGNGLASLLLGWGTDGHVGTQPPAADKSKDQGMYIQDDWKITQRLTLNMGLRYEWSTPFTERYNRLVVADYQGDTGVNVPGLGPLKGTSVLAGPGQRTSDVDRNNVGPRLGLAYRVNDKTVVRGGAGLYYGLNVATNFQYVGTPWYKNVLMYFSKDGGITPYASLSDPFPVGFVGPPGGKYGTLSQWGFDNGYNLNYGLRNAEIYQWNVGIERELPGNMLIEVNYSASRSTHLPFNGYDGTRNRNFIDRENREKYGNDGLAELVDNPFLPFFQGPNAIFNEPDSPYNDPQIQRIYLLRPFPQFSGSFGGYPEFIANARYNSLQIRFEKRYSHGLNFTGNYTFSKMTDDNSLGFNPWVGNLQSTGELQDLTNLKAEKSISGVDTPHRLAFAVSYELPVGRGKPLGKSMNRALDAALGGWKINSFVTFQTGNPVGTHMDSGRLADGNQRPNVQGDVRGADILTVVDGNGNFFNQSAFSDPGDQVPGNAPRYFSDLRTQGIRNLDLSVFKAFEFRENMSLQLRAEFFNFTNTPRFGLPNTSFGSTDFGLITDQSNQSRHGQIGIRFVW